MSTPDATPLKFDDVLEPAKYVEIRGRTYGLPADIPTDIVVLEAKIGIAAVKAGNELSAIEKGVDEEDTDQVAAAIQAVEESTRRVTELQESAEARILEFFNDPEHCREPVERLPLSVSDFYGKLVPHYYGDTDLADLLPGASENGAEGAGADPTQANARRVRAQAGTKSTKRQQAKKKPKASSSSTS